MTDCVKLPPAHYRLVAKTIPHYIQIKYPSELINNVKVAFENSDEYNEYNEYSKISNVCRYETKVDIERGSIFIRLPLTECDKYKNAPTTLTITGSGPLNNPHTIDYITQYT